MDIERNLRIAINTGKVLFGIKEARKALEKRTAKMIVLAENCPSEFLKDHEGAKVLQFPGDNIALGALCGKPFSISVVTIVDQGESTIVSG
jgi:large subunit ribosomal protein L30e